MIMCFQPIDNDSQSSIEVLLTDTLSNRSILVLCVIGLMAGQHHATFARAATYMLKQAGFKRQGDVINTFFGFSITQCGHQCLGNAECVGFSFGTELDFTTTECYLHHRSRSLSKTFTWNEGFGYYEIVRQP